MITVTISSPSSAHGPIWDELVLRASPNAFMNPAALQAAASSGFSRVHVLVAHDDSVTPHRPVGLWALQERRVIPFMPTVLEAIPYNYAFLSSPVIDPAHADSVMTAFFTALRTSRALPKVVSLKQLDGEAASYQAICKIIDDEGNHLLQLGKSQRPIATPESGVKKSGSTRKKLRQDWNRLGALGPVDIVNFRDSALARQDFETFLALEMNSWKGMEGTALLCSKFDARFVREMFSALSAQGNASVALLRVDGRAIAAQVLMYCGNTAYTWKTAFDAEFGKFSPGALLIDKVTEELFAGGGIIRMDSCSAEGSFMANLWTGRRTQRDVLVDLSPHKSASFVIQAGCQLGREWLKNWRDRAMELSWPHTGKKTSLVSQQ